MEGEGANKDGPLKVKLISKFEGFEGQIDVKKSLTPCCVFFFLQVRAQVGAWHGLDHVHRLPRVGAPHSAVAPVLLLPLRSPPPAERPPNRARRPPPPPRAPRGHPAVGGVEPPRGEHG